MYQHAANAVASGDLTTRPFVFELEFADIFDEGGGFDIVIANPPYVSVQGSSGLPYRDELKRRYTERVNGREKGWVDDLYVHFVFRAFELARPGGVVCFITSDTYFTIQSKWRMRELLHGKDLRAVAPCNPFEATVDAAVFLAFNRPRLPEPECKFGQMRYVSDEDFDRLSEEPAWQEGATVTVDSTAYQVQEWTEGKFRRYRFDPRLWLGTQRMAIWEPSRRNACLYERLILPAEPVLHEWWDKIENSKKYRKHLREIEGHLLKLRPGDVTLVGLLGDGGMGLSTGDNSSFLAVEDGSSVADETRRAAARLVESWLGSPRLSAAVSSLLEDHCETSAIIDAIRRSVRDDASLGLGSGQVYRVVSPDMVIGPDDIPRNAVETGLADSPRKWVPYRKGDRSGARWWSNQDFLIDYGRDAVEVYRGKTRGPVGTAGAMRNPHLFLRAGVTWTLMGNHVPMKARLQPPCMFDAVSPTIVPGGPVDAELLLAILNSALFSYVLKTFVANVASFAIGDVRQMPLEYPDEEACHQLRALARQAVERAVRGLDTQDLCDAVDRLVTQSMGLANLGPFDEY